MMTTYMLSFLDKQTYVPGENHDATERIWC